MGYSMYMVWLCLGGGVHGKNHSVMRWEWLRRLMIFIRSDIIVLLWYRMKGCSTSFSLASPAYQMKGSQTFDIWWGTSNWPPNYGAETKYMKLLTLKRSTNISKQRRMCIWNSVVRD